MLPIVAGYTLHPFFALGKGGHFTFTFVTSRVLADWDIAGRLVASVATSILGFMMKKVRMALIEIKYLNPDIDSAAVVVRYRD